MPWLLWPAHRSPARAAGHRAPLIGRRRARRHRATRFVHGMIEDGKERGQCPLGHWRGRTGVYEAALLQTGTGRSLAAINVLDDPAHCIKSRAASSGTALSSSRSAMARVCQAGTSASNAGSPPTRCASTSRDISNRRASPVNAPSRAPSRLHPHGLRARLGGTLPDPRSTAPTRTGGTIADGGGQVVSGRCSISS